MATPSSRRPGRRRAKRSPSRGTETNARPTPASRLFGAGLAAAALAILALALLAFVELDREGRLHRDVIAKLEAIDAGDTLRANLVELGHAARIAALTDPAESHRRVEQLAEDIETGLAALSERPPAPDAAAAAEWSEFMASAQLPVLNARSV